MLLLLLKLKSIDILYKMPKISEDSESRREAERENRHSEEEDELRDQTGDSYDGLLLWHGSAAIRTEKPGTWLGRRLLQVNCWFGTMLQ